MPKTENFNIRLDEDDRSELIKVAAHWALSRAEVLRFLVRRELGRIRKAERVKRRRSEPDFDRERIILQLEGGWSLWERLTEHYLEKSKGLRSLADDLPHGDCSTRRDDGLYILRSFGSEELARYRERDGTFVKIAIPRPKEPTEAML